jgi:hypothetical protein
MIRYVWHWSCHVIADAILKVAALLILLIVLGIDGQKERVGYFRGGYNANPVKNSGYPAIRQFRCAFFYCTSGYTERPLTSMNTWRNDDRAVRVWSR